MAKSTAVKENRYAPYEAKLDARGVKYTYVASVPLEDITRYPDAQSRMRLAGKDTVKNYAERMKQGEVFPPLVLGEDGTSDYMLLDGNTRKAAKESLGHTHTDAYIIDDLTDHNDAIYLSALFNTINGTPLTKDEQLRTIQAANATAFPPTAKTLAKDLGIAPAKITRLIKVDAMETKLKNAGITAELTEDMKLALEPIGDVSVLREAVNLVVDADLKGKDVRPLVKDLAAAGSEADRLKRVSDERTDRQTSINLVAAGRTSVSAPTKDSLMVFGRLHSLITKFPDPTDWVPVRQETRDEWHSKLGEIESFLKLLQNEYEVVGIS